MITLLQQCAPCRSSMQSIGCTSVGSNASEYPRRSVGLAIGRRGLDAIRAGVDRRVGLRALHDLGEGARHAALDRPQLHRSQADAQARPDARVGVGDGCGARHRAGLPARPARGKRGPHVFQCRLRRRPGTWSVERPGATHGQGPARMGEGKSPGMVLSLRAAGRACPRHASSCPDRKSAGSRCGAASARHSPIF